MTDIMTSSRLLRCLLSPNGAEGKFQGLRGQPGASLADRNGRRCLNSDIIRPTWLSCERQWEKEDLNLVHKTFTRMLIATEVNSRQLLSSAAWVSKCIRSDPSSPTRHKFDARSTYTSTYALLESHNMQPLRLRISSSAKKRSHPISSWGISLGQLSGMAMRWSSNHAVKKNVKPIVTREWTSVRGRISS